MNVTKVPSSVSNKMQQNTQQKEVSMDYLQKAGGVAALIEAATFLVGFALFFTLIAAANYGSLEISPVQNAAFLSENQLIMYAWNFIIYVLFGLVLVVLTFALHQRLKTAAHITPVATAFGLIWSGLVIASGMVANVGASVITDLYAKNPEQAGDLWLSLHVVVDGLGGGNEIVGGIWVVLLSVAALRVAGLPRSLNTLGIVVGCAGLLTSIPAFAEIGGSIFGLGLIVWFIWLGVVMLMSNPAQT